MQKVSSSFPLLLFNRSYHNYHISTTTTTAKNELYVFHCCIKHYTFGCYNIFIILTLWLQSYLFNRKITSMDNMCRSISARVKDLSYCDRAKIDASRNIIGVNVFIYLYHVKFENLHQVVQQWIIIGVNNNYNNNNNNKSKNFNNDDGDDAIFNILLLPEMILYF